jgi:hypothetical protein
MTKKRTRTERRRIERELGKLADAREKLALASAGGAPERPITVESASVIESIAEALGCARCDGEARVEEHAAERGLRKVTTRCRACGSLRVVWVQIASRLLS